MAKSKEADKFDRAMKALVQVPKAELDEQEKRQAARKRRKKRKTKGK